MTGKITAQPQERIVQDRPLGRKLTKLEVAIGRKLTKLDIAVGVLYITAIALLITGIVLLIFCPIAAFFVVFAVALGAGLAGGICSIIDDQTFQCGDNKKPKHKIKTPSKWVTNRLYKFHHKKLN